MGPSIRPLSKHLLVVAMIGQKGTVAIISQNHQQDSDLFMCFLQHWNLHFPHMGSNSGWLEDDIQCESVRIIEQRDPQVMGPAWPQWEKGTKCLWSSCCPLALRSTVHFGHTLDQKISMPIDIFSMRSWCPFLTCLPKSFFSSFKNSTKRLSGLEPSKPFRR